MIRSALNLHATIITRPRRINLHARTPMEELGERVGGGGWYPRGLPILRSASSVVRRDEDHRLLHQWTRHPLHLEFVEVTYPGGFILTHARDPGVAPSLGLGEANGVPRQVLSAGTGPVRPTPPLVETAKVKGLEDHTRRVRDKPHR